MSCSQTLPTLASQHLQVPPLSRPLTLRDPQSTQVKEWGGGFQAEGEAPETSPHEASGTIDQSRRSCPRLSPGLNTQPGALAFIFLVSLGTFLQDFVLGAVFFSG